MNEISTKELKDLLAGDKKFFLLDCRGVDYYNWEHLPSAVNLRWKYVTDRAEKLLPDKKSLIVTSCDGFTCGASIRCYENLTRLGYTNVLEYSGGIADWAANQLPVEVNADYHVAPNVYRFPDQSFFGEQVGSYLIEENDFILLVDGPQTLSDEHEDFICHFDKPIHIFMTHGPTGGSGSILQKKYRAKIYLHQDDAQNEWLTVKPDTLITDRYKFGKNLTVIHTPGHTPGSSVLFDQKNKILFSGDHIEGENSKKIFDFIRHDDGFSGDPDERLKNAEKLLKYDFDKILPFHYQMIPKDAKKILTAFVRKHESSNH